MINVLFFAQLREQLGCDNLTIQAADNMTVATLKSVILEANPQWQAFFADRPLLSAVNQTLVDENTALTDNDEVAFFPPVTGG